MHSLHWRKTVQSIEQDEPGSLYVDFRTYNNRVFDFLQALETIDLQGFQTKDTSAIYP